MKMSKGRCIGILLVAAVSSLLTALLLFLVSPVMMVLCLMAAVLTLALLWRFRPGTFAFLKCLKTQEETLEPLDIGSSISREMFFTDMVLSSVDAVSEQVIHLNKKMIVIGMAEGCDVVMPRDSGVSRIHAKVFYSNREERFLVEDNDSSNGTYLNNVRLTKGKPQILCKGDRLRFAKTEFVVKSAYYK